MFPLLHDFVFIKREKNYGVHDKKRFFLVIIYPDKLLDSVVLR